MTRRRSDGRTARLPAAAGVLLVLTACGKSGPPLPPLVRLPSPPGDFTAERRADDVDVRFTVPSANADGSRPADIERVDVYAVTSAGPMTDDQLFKQGTKIASVPVKRPRHPDETVEADEPVEDVEPPEGSGLDQGSVARVAERLTPDATIPVQPRAARASKPRASQAAESSGPLVGAPTAVPVRTYVGVGISTRGRRGSPSGRATVPLVSPPPPPTQPAMTYDETAVALEWPPVSAAGVIQQPATGDVLPSKPIGAAVPSIAYNVYDASQATPERLTATPVAKTSFSDTRMTWGNRRCYVVRVVETVGSSAIESEPSPAVCETLVDTFPPAAPHGLSAVPSEGAISLIWEPNTEKDLAGYVVLRGAAPDGPLEPITPAPIQDTTFQDRVPAGMRYVYAIRAVDKAGNASPPSNRQEETAR